MDRYDSVSNYCSQKLQLAYQTKKTSSIIYNADDPILSKELKKYKDSKQYSIKKNNNSFFKLNVDKVYSGENYNYNILFASIFVKKFFYIKLF